MELPDLQEHHNGPKRKYERNDSHARKAGRSLAKDFREVENLQVSITGSWDFVSRAILQAEKIIKEELTLETSRHV